MFSRMDAEIVTSDNPEPIIAKLLELGFEMEVIDWLPEEYGTTIIATTLTTLDADAFCNYIENIVAPFDVTIIDAGMVQKPGLIRAPGVIKRSFITMM
jgi:hypothetical protein